MFCSIKYCVYICNTIKAVARIGNYPPKSYVKERFNRAVFYKPDLFFSGVDFRRLIVSQHFGRCFIFSRLFISVCFHLRL